MKEHKTPCICNTCLRARDKELKAQRENIIKVIEEIYACDGGDDCKCNTEMGKNISTGRHSMKMQIIKALKDEQN